VFKVIILSEDLIVTFELLLVFFQFDCGQGFEDAIVHSEWLDAYFLTELKLIDSFNPSVPVRFLGFIQQQASYSS